MLKAFVITAVCMLAGAALAGIIHDYPDHRYQHQHHQLSVASSHSHSRESYAPIAARLEQSDTPPASSAAAAASSHGDHAAEPTKVEHKHKIKHEHATSHQTFKIHHFHPVAVYVKKEDQHLLKHPLEIGGVNHKLKQIHPEAVKSHGYGIVLENHTDQKHQYHDQKHHHEAPAPAIGVKHAAEQIAHLHDFTQHSHEALDAGPLRFHDINVRSGGSPFE